jgi:NADPH:quinone reductase-like Zn-dependent oxidoreductase/acyl carrier protein
VIGEADEGVTSSLADTLRDCLAEAGGEVTLAHARHGEEDWSSLPGDARPDDLVLLFEHRAGTRQDGTADETTTALRRTTCLRALLKAIDGPGANVRTPRVWIVNSSAGALPVPGAVEAPADAATWGLAHVLDIERPGLAVRHVALRPTGDPAADARVLVQELACPDDEDEVVLTEHGRFVSRLRPVRSEPAEARSGPCALLVHDPGPGHSLDWERLETESAEDGEVLVEVRAASVTPRDVARARGEVTASADAEGRHRPGLECAGVVIETGRGVTGLFPGQRVYGLARGACATRVRARAGLLAPIPDGMRFTEAATLPATFLTVRRGLERLARLGPGETLFVRGAGGGLALAAVAHARQAGADVIAAAEQEADRDLLRAAGVCEVFDSADPALPRHLSGLTGQGPDVVLDCAGAGASDAAELLPPGGRLVRVVQGAPDDRAPRARHSDVLLATVDTEWAVTARPEAAAALFADVAARVAEGAYRPLPFTCHQGARAAEAFDGLRSGFSTGHTVLDLTALPRVRQRHRPLALDGQGCYLVTGGLSGLGAETARWLAERGARRLALVSRSGRAAKGAEALLAELGERGAHATAHAVDVTVPEQVRELVAELEAAGTPLRGVIHAAVVLRDAPFEDGDEAADRAVLEPKLTGTRVLDAVTRTRQHSLDFFVVYSSVTNTIGNLHQATYAAGNAAAEAVVRERRKAGLPGLAVQWGGIEGVGALADPALARNLTKRGMGLVTPRHAFAALEELLGCDAEVTAVLNNDWERMAEIRPHIRERPRLRHLAPHSEHVDRTTMEARRHRLSQAPLQEARSMAEEMLTRLAGRVLGAPPGGIDSSRGLDHLGIDSIMATELIGAIRKEFGCELAAVEVASGPSLAELASRVVTRLRERDAAGEPR